MRMSNPLPLVVVLVLLLGAGTWALFAGAGDTPQPAAPAAAVAGERASPDEPGAGGAQRTLVADERADETQLRGRVLDAYGEPVAGALVGEVGSDRPTRTGRDGRFELGVARGPASAELLVLARDQTPLLTRHDVPAAALHELGDLQLPRGGALHGRITDAAGNGLPGAVATLHAVAAAPAGFDRDRLLAPQVADAHGAFAFEHLAPGAYRVRASANGWQTARSAPLAVRDGEPTDAPPLVLAPGHELRGIVLGPAGEPLAAASVRVRLRSPQARFDDGVETAADGRFVCAALPPGALQVSIEKAGFLRQELTGVDATRGEELVVRLAAGLRLTGIVTDARTGQPVERFAATIRRLGDVASAANGSLSQQLERQIAQLRAAAAATADATSRADASRLADELQDRLLRVRQQAAARPLVVPAERGPVQPRPGGTFAFEGLEAGLYAVSVWSPRHQFARQEPIAVQSGVALPELRFGLVGGHALGGVVVAAAGGAAVPGATVELMRVADAASPSDAVRDQRRARFPWLFAQDTRPGVPVMSAATGGDGSFRCEQVPPGRYFVTVRHPRFADFDGPEFVVGGDLLELRLALDARAGLTGRVTGVPAPLRGKVSVLVCGGHGAMRTVAAADDGAYRCEDLPPGSYLVRAFPDDATRYVDRLFGELFPARGDDVARDQMPPCDVTLTAGETRTHDVALDLQATGGVRGQILINGQPAKSASVLLRPVAGEAPGSGGLSLRGSTDDAGQFEVGDVPAGNYTFLVLGATRQELHREALTVAAGEIQVAQRSLVAGGLRGRVLAPDGGAGEELRGNLWLLPGATEAPADLYEFQKQHRSHRVSVRNGAFEDRQLTPGPAVVLIDLRGRPRVATAVTVPVADVLVRDFEVGPRGP